VERLGIEEPQDEHIERARRESSFSRHSLTMHVHESSTGVNRHPSESIPDVRAIRLH
jgi:hypothetical protein